MHSRCTVLLLSLLWPAFVSGEATKTPEIQKIVRPYTPEFIDLGRLTTADSATITTPAVRTILDGSGTTIEVQPRCRIDSMTIFVRHSATKIDTLACLHQPPWRTTWQYASLPDQDQIHLQFGYHIYQPGGKVLTSPSLPHQWAIDRATGLHHNRYRCVQMIKPDTIAVDGNADEWKRIRRASIGSDGTFALCWTSATVLTPPTLYFLAEIRQREVRPTDVVELHLDPYRTRTSLASEKHRSILFGPMGRSYTYVNDSVDAKGFRQCDSIAALVNDGMQWRATVNDSGYVVEAAIPFYSLSELKHPPKKFGLDVTIRSGTQPFHFAGWANSNEYARYNPGEWGTATLGQVTLPLDILLLLGVLIIAVTAGTVVVVAIRNSVVSQTLIRKEASGESLQLQQIRNEVTRHLDDTTMSAASIAAATGIAPATITAILRNELDSTLERFVGFARIEEAKRLLADFSRQPDEIASRCGFSTLDEMNKKFMEFLHTDTEKFRAMMRDRTNDDDDETSHRPRSDALTPRSPTDLPQ